MVALTSGATRAAEQQRDVRAGDLVGRGAADLPDRLEDQPDPVDEALQPRPRSLVRLDNDVMLRPSSPLISHDAVVEASLRIIDADGLDAFSLPRLARELNIQAPSLYHHFQDRAHILRTVARAIVLESRVPAPAASRTWVDWFTGISLPFRRAVLSRRSAAPILLEFMLIWNYELGVQILAAVGVPPEARIAVIDGLDTLTLGASLAEAAKSPARAGQVFANVDADAEPVLAEALAANTRTAEQLFADAIRSFLRGAVPGVPEDAPAPRELIARYRETREAAGA